MKSVEELILALKNIKLWHDSWAAFGLQSHRNYAKISNICWNHCLNRKVKGGTLSHFPLNIKSSCRVKSSLLNKVSKMAFDIYQRNICLAKHIRFQTGTSQHCVSFNLEGFRVFRQNVYLPNLIYVLKIIIYTAFKLFWQSFFYKCIKHI